MTYSVVHCNVAIPNANTSYTIRLMFLMVLQTSNKVQNSSYEKETIHSVGSDVLHIPPSALVLGGCVKCQRVLQGNLRDSRVSQRVVS